MHKVRWVMSYETCSKFHTLSSSTKIFEYRLRFLKVTENLKVGTFFETQCLIVALSYNVTVQLLVRPERSSTWFLRLVKIVYEELTSPTRVSLRVLCVPITPPRHETAPQASSSVMVSVSMSVCLSVCLPLCLSVCLSVCVSVCLPAYTCPDNTYFDTYVSVKMATAVDAIH